MARGDRAGIVSLISTDLERKAEQKKRNTAADILKTKLNIGGRRDVATIQQAGASAREDVSQTGATFRQNIAVAGDKAVQAMRGRSAINVQTLRGSQAVSLQDLRGEQDTGIQKLQGKQKRSLLSEGARLSENAAASEFSRKSSATKAILATIPVIDSGEFTFDSKKKKEEDSQRLLVP
jgi:hypothetical protein